MKFKLMPDYSFNGTLFYRLLYVCMGCNEIFGGGIQGIPVNTKAVSPAWTWNNNLLAPSIEEEICVKHGEGLCRATLTNGIFKYHTDSTHRYSGYLGYAQPFPDWFMDRLELQAVAHLN